MCKHHKRFVIIPPFSTCSFDILVLYVLLCRMTQTLLTFWQLVPSIFFFFFFQFFLQFLLKFVTFLKLTTCTPQQYLHNGYVVMSGTNKIMLFLVGTSSQLRCHVQQSANGHSQQRLVSPGISPKRPDVNLVEKMLKLNT